MRRTRPRRRICIRREGRRTRKSPSRHREHRCTDRDRILTGTQAPRTGIQSLYNGDTFGLDWSFYPQRTETVHLLGFAKRGYSITLQRKCAERKIGKQLLPQCQDGLAQVPYAIFIRTGAITGNVNHAVMPFPSGSAVRRDDSLAVRKRLGND